MALAAPDHSSTKGFPSSSTAQTDHYAGGGSYSSVSGGNRPADLTHLLRPPLGPRDLERTVASDEIPSRLGLVQSQTLATSGRGPAMGSSNDQYASSLHASEEQLKSGAERRSEGGGDWTIQLQPRDDACEIQLNYSRAVAAVTSAAKSESPIFNYNIRSTNVTADHKDPGGPRKKGETREVRLGVEKWSGGGDKGEMSTCVAPDVYVTSTLPVNYGLHTSGAGDSADVVVGARTEEGLGRDRDRAVPVTREDDGKRSNERRLMMGESAGSGYVVPGEGEDHVVGERTRETESVTVTDDQEGKAQYVFWGERGKDVERGNSVPESALGEVDTEREGSAKLSVTHHMPPRSWTDDLSPVLLTSSQKLPRPRPRSALKEVSFHLPDEYIARRAEHTADREELANNRESSLYLSWQGRARDQTESQVEMSGPERDITSIEESTVEDLSDELGRYLSDVTNYFSARELQKR